MCAFFEKRLHGALPHGGAQGGPQLSISELLFGPFWGTAERLGGSLGVLERSEGQWCPEAAWARRAQGDGTARALALLRFRVNRLSRLLSVCDCWASNVGSHLALWLDSHMHLVLACETRQSGPSRADSAGCAALELCDFRFIPDDLVMALRFALGGNGSVAGAAPVAALYARVMCNMSVCKTLAAVLRPLRSSTSVKKCVCSAVARCILGMTTNKASFHTRVAVHRMISAGLDDFFDMAVRAAEAHARPVVFMCLREHGMHCVSEDLSLSAFLRTVPKWNVYHANVVATMDSLRVGLKSDSQGKPTTQSGSYIEHICTVADDRFACFARNAKRVPGLVSRERSKIVPVGDLCKSIKRARDRARDEKAIATENFADPAGVGTRNLVKFTRMPAGENFAWNDIRQTLGTQAAENAFVNIIAAMTQGPAGVKALLAAAHPPSPSFAVAGDCLQLVRTASAVRSYKLPAAYTALQRKAVANRFSDTRCAEQEQIKRAAHILWCAGCGAVKNFVVGVGKKNENSHASHGYKRICHDGEELKCDERRLYECCKTVPIKRIALLSLGAAADPADPADPATSCCVDIFGCAYVLTTCCGRIATLDSLCYTAQAPLVCARCAKAEQHAANAGPLTRICHFCTQAVVRKKGSFTGKFLDSSQRMQMLTFCKRHTRVWMRREAGRCSLTLLHPR